MKYIPHKRLTSGYRVTPEELPLLASVVRLIDIGTHGILYLALYIDWTHGALYKETIKRLSEVRK